MALVLSHWTWGWCVSCAAQGLLCSKGMPVPYGTYVKVTPCSEQATGWGQGDFVLGLSGVRICPLEVKGKPRMAQGCER